MRRFKNFLNEDIDFLTEAKDFSTAMESVLGVAYAAASKGGTNGINYLKKEIKGSYSGDFKITKTANPKEISKKDIDNLMLFGENIKTAIEKAGNFKFQAKGKITDFWSFE